MTNAKNVANAPNVGANALNVGANTAKNVVLNAPNVGANTTKNAVAANAMSANTQWLNSSEPVPDSEGGWFFWIIAGVVILLIIIMVIIAVFYGSFIKTLFGSGETKEEKKDN